MSVSRRHAAAAALVATSLAFVVTPAIFDLDDAYIALYSAQAAIAGTDRVWGSPALAGATSPAYVALIAALIGAGLKGIAALRAATALGVAAYVMALWRLGAAFALPPARRVALTVITLGSGLVLMQATNGLETGWALALSTWLIAQAVEHRLHAVAAGAALLPFLRPDLTPAAALLILYAGRQSSWRQWARAGAIALTIAAPFFLWMRLDTGSWVPQTMQAKALFFAEACAPLNIRSTAVMAAVCGFLVTIAPLAINAVTLPRERLGRYGLIAIAATLAAFAVRFPGGLTHNYSRYLYAIVTPWLSLGLALRLARSGVLASPAMVTGLAAVTLASWPLLQPPRAAAAAELIGAVDWVERNVPADASLLTHDAGAVSVFAHRRAVDLVGLKTPASIEAHRRWTAPSCGRDRGRAIAEIAATSHASYVVVVSDWDAIFNVRASLESAGFVLDPVRVPPPNTRGYTVYRMHSGKG